ncbi:hypothetical protein HAX54_032725 [Datura stramonium]|uniref:DC1 domain-containing protein n=1 Tax=Datura stramonium TaxID=4076 RepID=A0ABS8SDL9_DATST|nr:hypothetical protein [Datura stramonium]
MGQTEENNILFQHFSHGHQFVYINKLPPKGNAICSGCKISILPGKFYYKCETCSFFLHHGCFNMPMNLQHLVDPIHHLTLLAATPSSSIHHQYSTKLCKACGKEITGFSYTCAICSTYYHTLCLALPLSMELPSHCHKLDLEFCPPYDFECDLCKKPSYNKGWLYHCSSCEFDAHISCAITHKGAHIENHSKSTELMELLSIIYIKGTETSTVSQEDQLDHPEQQTPSYQFSDNCFSIDLAKSQLLINDEQTGSQMRKEAVEIPEKPNHAAYITLPKGPKGVNLPSSNGNNIGSEIWMGLGREMEKAYQTNDSNKDEQLPYANI